MNYRESTSTYIVLGSGVNKNNRPGIDAKIRVSALAELLNNDPSAQVILTGGSTAGSEFVSEADSMLSYLKAIRKNPEINLILEKEATDTSTNLQNSLNLLRTHNIHGIVRIVTNDYHAKRVELLAKQLGIQGEVVIAESIVKHRSERHRNLIEKRAKTIEARIKEYKDLCFRIVTQLPFAMPLIQRLAKKIRI